MWTRLAHTIRRAGDPTRPVGYLLAPAVLATAAVAMAGLDAFARTVTR
jgi:hypothetical protein